MRGGADATFIFAPSRVLYAGERAAAQSFVVTLAPKRHLKIAYNIEMMPVLASPV